MFSNLLNAPTAFETLFYFHYFVFVEHLRNYQRSKTLKSAAATTHVNYESGMRIAFAVRLVIKMWKLVL